MKFHFFMDDKIVCGAQLIVTSLLLFIFVGFNMVRRIMPTEFILREKVHEKFDVNMLFND